MDYLIARLLSAALAGILFSQSGSLIQLGTRNILASPSTLGFDGLSVLWVLILHSVAIVLGFELGGWQLALAGIPFFSLTAWIYARQLHKRSKFERVILLGLTFNLLVGALFSLWQFFFMAFNLPFPVELWFGHFRFADGASVMCLVLTEAAVLAGLGYFWKELVLYSLGSEVSRNWKLREFHLFFALFLLVGVGTSVVVSLFGAFSFLGLVFPLVARRLWFQRYDLKGELIFGAVANGIGLMLIDLLCYQFPLWGAEVPVGLLMTVIGAVSLILLLWKSKL